MHRLIPQSTLILVIDVQERLAPAMPQEQLVALLRATNILAAGANILGAHVAVTEQYPKGLGHTVEAVRTSVANAKVFEKITFSAAGDENFRSFLNEINPRAVVVVGMEAHICVYQSVRDLVRLGCEVHVPVDGVASRREDHRSAGLSLCNAAGGVLTTTETIVFDWLERAGSDAFRAISKLVR